MRILVILLLIMPTFFYAKAQETNIKEAHALLLDGELDQALVMFNAIEGKHENNAEFYFLRGTCLSELGQDDEAVIDFDISISLDNSNPTAFYQRGFSYFNLGKSPDALNDFNQAIDLDPKYGEAYLNRGTVHYDLGNTEAACQDWQVAVASGLTLASALLQQLCED